MTHNRRKDDDIKELIKIAIKESQQEWLDAQFSKFGKWSLTGIISVIFIWILSIWIMSHISEISNVAGTKIISH